MKLYCDNKSSIDIAHTPTWTKVQDKTKKKRTLKGAPNSTLKGAINSWLKHKSIFSMFIPLQEVRWFPYIGLGKGPRGNYKACF